MGKDNGFEEKIKKAQEILQTLSDPQITLEKSVKAYEEGMKELKEATKMLEEAKLKVNQIKEN
jgi:exodeoxyribonuclease VII small subunit